MSIPPLKDSIRAKHHTPIYTVHRYFARRPHNVFSNIIQHYSGGKEITVLDPFSGGGVTLIEALSLGHRAIGFEINELASFVIRNELLYVSRKELNKNFLACLAKTYKKVGYLYNIGGAQAYWLLWESFTDCPKCGNKTYLTPHSSSGSGVYRCAKCATAFRPKRISSNDIEIRESCLMDVSSTLSGRAANLRAGKLSQAILKKHSQECQKFIHTHGYALKDSEKTPIPECNLEKESALHKKNFLYFEDFFPAKSHAWIQAFAESIEELACDDAIKEILFYLLSASLRYISRFSTLNKEWRGHYKPLEWAKSNFWTPYSFVEFNPFMAIWDRYRSYEKALQDLEKRFPQSKPEHGNIRDVLLRKSNFSLINKSSHDMANLPDNSIDLILTDPPYGSYLHYGELSGFWLCWLKKFNKKYTDVNVTKKSEAVVSRKKHKNYKSFLEYENILTDVFSECWRVLKANSYLVLTFNNKEPEAWVALLRAIKKAGFSLPEGGLIFQDGVETYKRTIDLRRNGAIHGDFIYSFQKVKTAQNQRVSRLPFDWRAQVAQVLTELRNEKRIISNAELYLRVNSVLIPRLYRALPLVHNPKLEEAIADLSLKNLEKVFGEYLSYSNGMWKFKYGEYQEALAS